MRAPGSGTLAPDGDGANGGLAAVGHALMAALLPVLAMPTADLRPPLALRLRAPPVCDAHVLSVHGDGCSLARLPTGTVDLFVYAGHAGHMPGARLGVPVHRSRSCCSARSRATSTDSTARASAARRRPRASGGLFNAKSDTWRVRGLVPGLYRFKVFHAELVLEPEELAL